MSVLGVTWDQKGVQLSCRPDPVRPPVRLDEVVRMELPQSASVDTSIRPSGFIGIGELLDEIIADDGNLSDRLTAALSNYLDNLVSVLESDVEAGVLLLGGVDHIVMVMPPSTPLAKMERLSAAVSRVGVEVTVVARYTACFAASLQRFEPMQPFLVCDWNDEFSCCTMLAHNTLRHLSPTGDVRRLKGVGPATLERMLVEQLRKAAEGSHGGVNSPQTNKFAAHCVGAILESGSFDVTSFGQRRTNAVAVLPPEIPQPTDSADGPNNPEAGSPVAPQFTLSETEIKKSWEPTLMRVGNFAANAAREARRTGVNTVVLSGRMFRVPHFFESVRSALQRGGISNIPSSMTDTALIGAHYCVRSRPMLPYDCGVILKLPDAPIGIGTLVLVRPAPLGEERQSEILELPLPSQGTLEISFYIRRLDPTGEHVIYEVMKSHLFAPALNRSQTARLRVGMRVDQGDSDVATVSVDIHDLNANEHIRFEQLPVLKGASLREPPLRNPQQLIALEWSARIQRARASRGERSLSATTEWRRALENRVPPIPRKTYAGHIMEAVRDCIIALAAVYDKQFDEIAEELRTWLLNEEVFSQKTPAEFQAEARRWMFDTMCRTAYQVSQSGGRFCTSWIRSYPPNSGAPTEDVCAKSLINSVSQDLATKDQEGLLVPAVSQLQSMFHWACCAPDSLNIAWHE